MEHYGRPTGPWNQNSEVLLKILRHLSRGGRLHSDITTVLNGRGIYEIPPLCYRGY